MSQQPTKVLIVEDDLAWLNIFHTLVVDVTKNFSFIHAIDMKNALAVIAKEQLDLIILDLMLPDSQPRETIRTISAHSKYIPTVIITTLSDKKLMGEAFASGMEDYLVKDQYDAKIFLHVVNQAIQRLIGRWTNQFRQNLEGIVKNLENIVNLEC